MIYPITQLTVGNLIKIYIKKINGAENIPKTGPFILTANHSSYADHAFLQTTVMRKSNRLVRFLGKIEHFRGLQKYWHEHYKAIPIDREAGGQDALLKASSALKKGDIIGIYPEGTRTLDGKLQRAKTGAIRLALSAKVPILPVGLIGTFEILPKGKTIPRLKRATVNFGKPIYLNDYYGKENDKKTLRLLTTKLMKEIAKLSKQKYEFD